MTAGGARTPALHDPSRDAESYVPALRRYFMKRVPACDVDDLIQDVLVSMRSRSASDGIINLQGYIFTVAANALKRAGRQKAAAMHPLTEEASPADHITPERVLLARREVEAVVAVIERLPRRTRDIFVAHRFEDMSYAAIAKAQGISVSAVEKHIMQALRMLWLEVRND